MKFLEKVHTQYAITSRKIELLPADEVLQNLADWLANGVHWGIGTKWADLKNTAMYRSIIESDWPDKYRQCNKPLYRGLRFNFDSDGGMDGDVLARLIQGDFLKERDIEAESWSFGVSYPRSMSEGETSEEGEGIYQLVFKYKPKPHQVFLNALEVCKDPRMKAFWKGKPPNEVMLVPIPLGIQHLHEYRYIFQGNQSPSKVKGLVVDKWTKYFG